MARDESKRIRIEITLDLETLENLEEIAAGGKLSLGDLVSSVAKWAVKSQRDAIEKLAAEARQKKNA
jgi:hypothetical protein